MQELKACRICLNIDVKLIDILTYPLCLYYEQTTGINPINSTDLPHFACYQCEALMKKFFLFKEKCLVGQNTLYNLSEVKEKVTEETLRSINREEINLAHNISIQNIPTEKTILLEYIELSPTVKEEYNVDVDYDSNFSFPLDDIKLEGASEELKDSLPPVLSDSDDNEPLSVHKSNKVKKKKAKKRGRKKFIKIDKTELVDDLQDIEIADGLPEELVEIIQPRKRGRKKMVEYEMGDSKRNKHSITDGQDETDLEEYVTIIRLTKEEQQAEITSRKESSNYLNAQYQCELCFKGFIDTGAWKNHVRKHDPSSGDVECDVCKFRFKNHRAYMKHAANHAAKYACKSCSFISKTTTQAKQHQRWHKGVIYKCQFCDEISTRWTSHLSHVRMKHPSEFICGICGYSFVSKLGLNMHKTMMHKDVVEQLEDTDSVTDAPYCKECDVRFISLEAYKRHMVMSTKHSESTEFKNGCRVCGETFNSAAEVKAHHRKEHAKKRPKNYGKKPSDITWPTKCEHCNQEISSAPEMWAHFRRQHPDKNYPIERNYVCDICGKAYRGNAFLEYHKRTHSEERPYKCSVCPKAFHNRTNLHVHLKCHSDERPYPCAVCFKAFKCKGALDRHYRCHTGDKPYECEVCGKSFSQSNSHKLHVRTVHFRQPAPYLSRARQEKRRAIQPQPYQ